MIITWSGHTISPPQQYFDCIYYIKTSVYKCSLRKGLTNNNFKVYFCIVTFTSKSRSIPSNNGRHNTGPIPGYPGPIYFRTFEEAIFPLSDSNRYDITSINWTNFYQEFKDTMAKFGLKLIYQIVTSRDNYHEPTNINNSVSSYLPTTQSSLYYCY